MRKLRSLCNRLSRREGLRFCVLALCRGYYRIYRHSAGRWCYCGTFVSVRECEDYLLGFERP